MHELSVACGVSVVFFAEVQALDLSCLGLGPYVHFIGSNHPEVYMEKSDFFSRARTDLSGPLQGVRVIEATTSWAGPMVGSLLADYGAEVIKVEHPEGEIMRYLTPRLEGPAQLPLMNEVLNRNKKSLSLDISKEEGCRIFLDLAKTCDLVVENFKPGTLYSWGLGYEHLRAVREDIIYLSVSGYGQYGPYHDRPSYDPLAQAFTGWMSLNGEVSGQPMKAPTFLADDVSGLHGCIAVLAALRHRDQTGDGQQVDVSLVDSVFHFSNANPTAALVGMPVEKQGNEFPTTTPFNTYECRDGWIYLGALLDSHFNKLCELMEQPELCHDERFSTLPARVAHRAEINQVVADWCLTQLREHAIELLGSSGIPVAAVNDFETAARSDHIREREMMQEVELSDGSHVPLTGPVAKFSRTPVSIREPAQPVGAQTDELLAELGIGGDERKALHDRGVI
jgi:crotonobetainyl-CoA:carnitine CoA-transferase CaiB-like acyl-CoA transferase|tara:strand:- start:698 stop:2053 length:1356 start_codon:yes stop_codon:yes gene_type:complete